MNKPQTVDIAVKVIWITLGASILVTLIDKVSGHIDDATFLFALVLYGLICILPYKIYRGSNSTRYIYAVITVLSYVLFFGVGTDAYPTLDVILTIILAPVEIFILYRLFHADSNIWFEAKKV